MVPYVRKWCIVFILFPMILVGCTTNTTGKNADGFIPHIVTDLDIKNSEGIGQFTVNVSMDGKPVVADQVVFEIWVEGEAHPKQIATIEGISRIEGEYIAQHPMNEQGIFIIRSHVSVGELEAKPAKHMAIGTEKIEQLAAMMHRRSAEAGAASEASESHHHH